MKRQTTTNNAYGVSYMLALPNPNGLNKHCPEKVFTTYLGVSISSPSSVYGFCSKMVTARLLITVYTTTFILYNKQTGSHLNNKWMEHAAGECSE